MKRAWMAAAVLVVGGVTASGCSSSPPNASRGPSTTSPVSAETPLAWLTANARRFNKKLNDDQALVDTASVTSPEIGASTYFARLAGACTRLNMDAHLAQQVQPSPPASLSSAWHAMTVQTETYAADCLTLTRTRSNASLTQWNQSLKAMNSANATLNAAVEAVRSQAGESAG